MKAEQEKLRAEYDRAQEENAHIKTDSLMGEGGAPTLGANGVRIVNGRIKIPIWGRVGKSAGLEIANSARTKSEFGITDGD